MGDNKNTDVPAAQTPLGRRRKTKQLRSHIRQQTIAAGAISAISKHGVAALTHRRVAQQARVSLAATTYYYRSKDDIVSHASQELLQQYVDAFQRFEARYTETGEDMSFRDFALKLVANALDKHKAVTLAWCEITLNAAHEPGLQNLTQSWYEALNGIWRSIAQLLGEDDIENAATSAIDAVVGFIFLLVPLGLTEDGLRKLLSNDVDSFVPDFIAGSARQNARAGTSRKAQETRERILNAALAIMASGANGPLTFKEVSSRAELTVPALIYHFPTVADLLNAAQMRLFNDAKLRYRSARGKIDVSSIDVNQAVEATAKVFMEESTQNRDLSLAAFPVYIQSARNPRLRSGLWAINVEQWHGWRPMMQSLNPSSRPFDAWFMAAVFTGKLIRKISTGDHSRDLSSVRKEFAYDLRGLANGRHWTSARP